VTGSAIVHTPRGYFVRIPGAAAPQGPYPSASAAERVLANAARRHEQSPDGEPQPPRPTTPATAPIVPRLLKAAPGGRPRRARRAGAAEERSKRRAEQRHVRAAVRKRSVAAAVDEDGEQPARDVADDAFAEERG